MNLKEMKKEDVNRKNKLQYINIYKYMVKKYKKLRK